LNAARAELLIARPKPPPKLAGAQAIATTNGGIAWSIGRSDGQRPTRAVMIGRVREIVAAVTVPITADIEGGYGPSPENVAVTVTEVIAAGAVGVNIEDSERTGPITNVYAGPAAVRSGGYRYGNTRGNVQNPLEPSQPTTERHLPP
jgi:hypothetical protein